MDCVYNYCFRFEILPCLFTYELTFFYGFYALGEKKKIVFTGYCLLLFKKIYSRLYWMFLSHLQHRILVVSMQK